MKKLLENLEVIIDNNRQFVYGAKGKRVIVVVNAESLIQIGYNSNELIFMKN